MEQGINELHYAIMRITDFSLEEANEVVEEARKLVKEGNNPEDILMDINLDPIYAPLITENLTFPLRKVLIS